MISLWQCNRTVNLDLLPDLRDKVYLVTGGTSGLGLHTVKALAAKNARVFLTYRNSDKLQHVSDMVKEQHPKAKIEGLHADFLQGFGSLAECAAEFKQHQLPLDCLINNVGTECPADVESGDGYEASQAINYLGAFYLTHLLMQQLTQTHNSRILNLSSLVEPHGKVNWQDLGHKRDMCNDYRTYADSKVKLFMFTAELQRRLRAAGSSTDVFSVHPGVSQTDIFQKSDANKLMARVFKAGAKAVGQSAGGGAQAVLNVATKPRLTGQGGGEKHWGPWYTGIPCRPFGQAWPLCFTVNHNNHGYRKPINPLIRNKQSCRRLYDETLQLINGSAKKKIVGLEDSPEQAVMQAVAAAS